MKNENLYYACDKCWHAMDYGQVYARGNSICPKCNVGTMRELAVMDIPAPPVGATLLCLLCAYYKPWGIFDSRTGVSVCAECRDKARNIAQPRITSDSARRAAEEIAREINGGDREDCSYPPALAALLEDPSNVNERALVDWIESIISKHFAPAVVGHFHC